MTEDDVRKIVLSMKGCLDPSHIACEKCSLGYEERVRHYETLMLDQGIRSGSVAQRGTAK